MRQVLLTIMVIVAVASLAAVGTYASFVDTETSAGNYFQAGSIDLQLADTLSGGENYGSWVPDEYPPAGSVVKTWHFNPNYPGGMEPGNWLESRVYLRNFGTMEADSLSIDCVNVNYDEYGSSVDDIEAPKDAVMVIEYLTYYNGPKVKIVWTDSAGQDWDTDYIVDGDGDLRITLHDLEVHGISGLDPAPLVDSIPPELAFLDMKVVFDPPADDTGPTGQYYRDHMYQGYRTDMTLIFILQ